jgi:hypothetical protein
MNTARSERELAWRPARKLASILDEIAEHVRRNPQWLEFCGAI